MIGKGAVPFIKSIERMLGQIVPCHGQARRLGGCEGCECTPPFD